MMDIRAKQVLTDIEKGFNVAGCIPVVSFVSSALRVLVGKVQAAVGAMIAFAGICTGVLRNDQKLASTMTILGSELVLHGALNVIRGAGEFALSAGTIVGNIFLLIPNMNQEKPFSPYIPYGALTDPVPVLA